jgi:hypothetical protein
LAKSARPFVAIRSYRDLTEVLSDRRLASLGDAYINFVYSIALSNQTGKPSGAKVRGTFLAEALRRAGLRDFLSSRVSRHVLADAAEALIIYGWLNDCITLKESVAMLQKSRDLVEGLRKLLATVKDRVTFP